MEAATTPMLSGVDITDDEEGVVAATAAVISALTAAAAAAAAPSSPQPQPRPPVVVSRPPEFEIPKLRLTSRPPDFREIRTDAIPLYDPSGWAAPSVGRAAVSAPSFYQPNAGRRVACADRLIPTAFCHDAQIARDLSAAEVWASGEPYDAAEYRKFAALWQEWQDASGDDRVAAAKKIVDGYPSRVVMIQGVSGEIEIANPYLARGRRLREDLSGANLRFVEAVAPREIVADKRAAVALLEAMWHCGSQPSLSDDPRCFPLRVLGEVREARKIRDMSGADVSAIIAASTKQTAAVGAAVRAAAARLAPAPAPAVAAAPAPAVAAPAPAPAPAVAAAPPTIPPPPIHIGGGGLRPLVPLARLGRR
jgi:hypothetical protein